MYIVGTTPPCKSIRGYSSKRNSVLFSKIIDTYSTESPVKLSPMDKLLSLGIASLQLIPKIDEKLHQYNWPRAKMVRHFKPHLGWERTDDGQWLRTYTFPAIDPISGKTRGHKKGKELILDSKNTIFTGHGYLSSPTAQLSLINRLNLLGTNVVTYDARGHGNSAGLFRSGYKTAIGYNNPLDLGAVIKGHRNKHPDDQLGYLGYSMGASGLMYYPKRLSLESFPEFKRGKIKESDLRESQEAIEGLQYLIYDSPYHNFDLMTNPVMARKLTDFSESRIAKKLFGTPAKAKERVTEILRHFNEKGSQEFLGITIPFKEFSPIKAYGGSKHAKETPTLLLHGKDDQDTLPIAQEEFKKSGVIEKGHYVELNADHSVQDFIDPTAQDKKVYYQMLRDKESYLPAVDEFLIENGAIDEGLLKDDKVKKALEKPEKVCLAACK